jgi:hypothetical protein
LSHHIISNATAYQHSSKVRAGQAACINRLSGEIRGGREITRLRGASPVFNKSSASTVREASGNIWQIAARPSDVGAGYSPAVPAWPDQV